MINCESNISDSEHLSIKGFIEASLLDFPLGRPGAVLFLAGCDSRCPYCQASHLVDNPDSLPSIHLSDIFGTLSELRGFVEGVTVTGGEVSLYKNLPEVLLQPLIDMGYMIKIDTYGARWDRVNDWIDRGLIHYLAIDIKGPWSKYPDILGRKISENSICRIRDWVHGLISGLSSCEFRTTVHPSMLTPEEIVDTAHQIEGADVYVLQNYKPVRGFDQSLQNKSCYSFGELRDIAAQIRQAGYVRTCFVRGFEKDAIDTEVVTCKS